MAITSYADKTDAENNGWTFTQLGSERVAERQHKGRKYRVSLGQFPETDQVTALNDWRTQADARGNAGADSD